MDKNFIYKNMFRFMAGYDILISAICLVASFAPEIFFPTFNMPIPSTMVWLQMTVLLIMCLGIGHLIVSMDIKNNHGVLIVGGIARALTATVMFIYFALGEIGLSIALLGIGDYIFIGLYVEFFLYQRKL